MKGIVKLLFHGPFTENLGLLLFFCDHARLFLCFGHSEVLTINFIVFLFVVIQLFLNAGILGTQMNKISPSFLYSLVQCLVLLLRSFDLPFEVLYLNI